MKRVHFIGVCGTAMATVAAMLKRRGFDVQGSDKDVYPPMSTFLEQERVTAFSGYRAEHIGDDVDLVVVGNAISRGNEELESVLDRKVRYCSLPELVREQFLWASQSVVVAGTHGKTTTTTLTGWLLTAGGLDPSVLVGGVSANFDSSYRLGGGRAFVIEGDEYDSAFFDKTAKFLKYLPDIAIVGNIEFDHADIYADLDAVFLAFRRFVNVIPRRGTLVLGADSPHAMRLREFARGSVITVGLDEQADWRATDVAPTPRGTRFALHVGGVLAGIFEVPLLGQHNVRNTLAAMAVGHTLGLSFETMREGLLAFRGVKRRLELRGEVGHVRVYDDFAHHPTAVAETLAALRLGHPGRRIWAVFEPRSATSCLQVFEQEFIEGLSMADEVVIAAVFRSSVPDDRRLSPERLVEGVRARGGHARYLPTAADIVDVVAREAAPGDLVVAMSNGGFDGIHDKLLAALQSRTV